MANSRVSAVLAEARAVKGAPYGWWDGSWPPPPGAPMYMDDRTYSVEHVKRHGINCTGLFNYAVEKARRDLVTLQDAEGGTVWYFDNVENRRELTDEMIRRGLPVGTVLVQDFVRQGKEGHICVVSTRPEENGRQLTIGSDAFDDGNRRPGVTERRTVREVVALMRRWSGGKVYAAELPGIGVVPLGDRGSGPENPRSPGLTVARLAAISQNSDPVFYDLDGDVRALVPEMRKAGITTKKRAAAFLANVSQETDHLNTLEEYGTRSYFRSFLGAQWRYHGRGYLMNTWKDAYERLSAVLGVDLVEHPDRLANRKDLAAKAAVWFWKVNNLNRYADRGEFRNVCAIINTGRPYSGQTINGYEMRVRFHKRALDILPDNFEL